MKFENVEIELLEESDSVNIYSIKKEGETRAYPVNIEDSNFFMDVDFVDTINFKNLTVEIVQE